MAVKIGDPDEIRQLARHLVTWSQETRDALLRLRAHLDQMQASQTWADDNHATYLDEFDQASTHLQQVLAEFEDSQASRLMDLASQYDDVRY